MMASAITADKAERHTMKYTISIILLAISLGCTDPAIEAPLTSPPSEQIFEKLVNGRPTQERPEVGIIRIDSSMCTATLIRADIVITAAHCLSYQTRLNTGNHGQFIVEAPSGRVTYTIEQFVSLGSEPGRDDIGLIKLSQPVPQSIARPVRLGSGAPSQGSQLTIYGYGCTERRNEGGSGSKRKVVFEQGTQSTNLCPGDSGGPVFSRENNVVTRINSAYFLDNVGADIYGDIPANFGRIQAKVHELSRVDDAARPQGNEGYDPTQGLTEVCGFHHTVQRTWTCNPDNTRRFRCRKGHAPEFENCSAGCDQDDSSTDATCKVGDQSPACGQAYSEYDNWTCTADGQHMLRCRQERVQIQQCGFGCNPGSIEQAGCEN